MDERGREGERRDRDSRPQEKLPGWLLLSRRNPVAQAVVVLSASLPAMVAVDQPSPFRSIRQEVRASYGTRDSEPADDCAMAFGQWLGVNNHFLSINVLLGLHEYHFPHGQIQACHPTTAQAPIPPSVIAKTRIQYVQKKHCGCGEEAVSSLALPKERTEDEGEGGGKCMKPSRPYVSLISLLTLR